jgi:anaerobic selenocysteine-containing dehydrogenase
MTATTTTRRKFLQAGTALTGAAAVDQSGLFSLKLLSPGEAQAMSLRAGAHQVRYTACTMCPAECGIEMQTQDGKVAKIYGNKAAPINDGACCAKGAAGQQLIYSPYRLKTPLIRVGARGEGKFRRASWDEAIDTIAKKLRDIKGKHGAESVVMDCGDVTDRDQYHRLFYAYGTPNCVEHGSICDTPRRHGPRLMLGGKRIEPDLMRPQLVRQPDGTLKKDYTYRTKLIIYNGWNPFVATRIAYESRGTVAAQVEAGCKVVVIDPSLSNTAARADLWLAPRAGTDGDLFAAMLRHILENDSPADPARRYIDWNFKKYSVGWEDFDAAFRSWWTKTDPINGLPYFTIDWAANRTGLTSAQIRDLAHQFGITKPAALVWGMQSPGHHFNGYCASIIGTALNVITGNLDVPGGAIDTETVKASKGGSANGKAFTKRKVKRMVDGKEVEGEVEHLHMDLFGSKFPAAWDDVVADYPNAIANGVKIDYGPLRGHRYPMKGYVLRTGNSVYTASAPYKWQEALTARDAAGNYKLELFVFIDTLNLESALYADVILPEASYAERQSVSDIYPSHPVLYNRDAVIAPLHECRKPTDIMNALAKRLAELGDTDIKGEDFWLKYRTEEDYVNEMLAPAPGRANIGTPLPYPKLPEGYTLIGTPDSLERGEVTVDDKNKRVTGKLLTVEWLRANHGVAIWPMSWYRYKKTGSDEPNGVYPPTSTRRIEFRFDWTEDGKRFGGYRPYNEKIEKAGGQVPEGLKRVGYSKYPSTFYWFETVWNPYTNPDYKRYAGEFPFQLISGKTHHAMSGTQMVPWLGEQKCEGTWQPMNNAFEAEIAQPQRQGGEPMQAKKHKFAANTYSVGTVWMNNADAKQLGLKAGDLVEVSNPLGKSTRGKVYASGGMRPGVIKMGFGSGGRFSPGMGPAFASRAYTPLHNQLVDPDALSPIMGFPAYADMVVKVRKLQGAQS